MFLRKRWILIVTFFLCLIAGRQQQLRCEQTIQNQTEAIRILKTELVDESFKVLLQNVSQNEITAISLSAGRVVSNQDWTDQGGIMPGQQRTIELKRLPGPPVPQVSVVGLLFRDDSGEGDSEALRGRRQAVRQFQVYQKVMVGQFLQERPEVTETSLLELKRRLREEGPKWIEETEILKTFYPSQAGRDAYLDGWQNARERLEREVDWLKDDKTSVPEKDKKAFRKARLEEIRDRKAR